MLTKCYQFTLKKTVCKYLLLCSMCFQFNYTIFPSKMTVPKLTNSKQNEDQTS